MKDKLIYIADKEELVIQGLKTLLCEECMNAVVIGTSIEEGTVLMQIEEGRPDILFIDERMMFDQFIPLYVILSLKYPKILIVLMTVTVDSLYDKKNYTEFVLSKSTLNHDTLLQLMEFMNKCIQNDRMKEEAVEPEGKEPEHSLPILEYERAILFSVYLGYAIQNISRRSMIKQLIYQALYRYESKVYVVTDQEDKITFLVNYKGRRKKEVEHDLENIIRVLQEQLHGIQSHNSNELPALRITSETVRQFNRESLLRFFYKRLPSRTGNKEKLMVFDFGHFKDFLNANDFANAINTLAQYIKKSIYDMIPPELLVSTVNMALLSCLSQIEGGAVTRENAPNFKLSMFENYSAFYAEFQAAAEYVLTLVKKDISSEEEQKMRNILEYIQFHYSEPLNLEDIAFKFNYNYHYLSVYFSKHMNKTFTDYLNDVRIKKACDLLKYKKTAISAVGNMVGYTNHSYFTKVFKKYMGMAPREYQRRVQISTTDSGGAYGC